MFLIVDVLKLTNYDAEIIWVSNSIIYTLVLSYHQLMSIQIKETLDVQQADIVAIYKANNWSSAQKPDLLYKALLNSHSFVTAWDDDQLVGLGNALSDGYLVVYYPHLIVHPDHQGKGIGKLILKRLQEKYQGFHQQILVADGKAVDFYRSCGFERAGATEPMWIYRGNDH
jgi:GNAT superfamily N-acetyltransferase